MQALAREMNLSETTFVLPSIQATKRVRIFTPASELPLAGHPTIGTWWLLAELGQVQLSETGITRITQEVGAGILPVDIHSEKGAPARVVMIQTLPEYLVSIDDTTRLCEGLGASKGDVLRDPAPQVVSTGVPQLMVPFVSLSSLEQLASGGSGADLAKYLREIGTDCAMCYSLDTVDSSATVHCRMFAPGLGVPEDPATGSAAGALGAYLVKHKIVTPIDGVADIAVEQGLEIDRPSRIDVQIAVDEAGDITEVRVGGKAKTIIKGEVSL